MKSKFILNVDKVFVIANKLRAIENSLQQEIKRTFTTGKIL